MDLKKFKAWNPGSGPSQSQSASPIMKMVAPWRSTIAVLVLVGAIGGAVYATIVRPMNHIDDWQKVQTKNRAGIRQEEVQPGGMRVWSSPFQPKKD